MTNSPQQQQEQLTELAAATDRLLDTARALTDTQKAAPSLLPGWTRGHVLTHVARNADAMRNLVTWAHSGVVTPAYPSREHRDADIAAGATRPVAIQLDDVRATAEALAADIAALPTESLDAALEVQPGRPIRAHQIADRRLREVEIHHVDLDAGYTFAHWPGVLVSHWLGEIADMFAGQQDTPSMTIQAADSGREWWLGPGMPSSDHSTAPVVSGPDRDLFAWLIGRGDGAGLSVSPTNALPAPPQWL